MTSAEGAVVTAPGWTRSTADISNTPDVNDAVGPLNTTVGYTWIGGPLIPSPDGGTWQNVYSREGFMQTISGLTIGQTYYFRYYYTTQGITGYGYTFNIPHSPKVDISGATGYTTPANPGSGFIWNSYCGELLATNTSITITASAADATIMDSLYYMAYDGFYLSATPFTPVQIIQQPQSVSLCNSGDLDFTIQSANAISLQWQVNTGSGWADIHDNALYSGTSTNDVHITNATVLMNNYQYRCMATNNACFLYSFPAALMVRTPSSPSLMITSSNTNTCPGGSISFNAVPLHGGSAPVFVWKKNNITVGTNSNTYTDNNFNTGDVINCILTSNEDCLTTSVITSNNITITIWPNPAVILDKTSTLCIKGTRLLDAGVFPSYLWNDGSTGRTLLVNNFGTYYVTVTDANGCKGSDTSKITTPLPVPANFLPPDTSICASLGGQVILTAKPGFIDYLWNTNANTSAIAAAAPGIYWLDVTDSNHCKGRDTLVVFQKQCIKGFFIPSAFSPNGDSKNDFYKPLLFGNIQKFRFSIYSRWGQLIFQSTDPAKGWDGRVNGVKQNGNAFIWICNYQFYGNPEQSDAGSVLLLK